MGLGFGEYGATAPPPPQKAGDVSMRAPQVHYGPIAAMSEPLSLDFRTLGGHVVDRPVSVLERSPGLVARQRDSISVSNPIPSSMVRSKQSMVLTTEARALEGLHGNTRAPPDRTA